MGFAHRLLLDRDRVTRRVLKSAPTATPTSPPRICGVLPGKGEYEFGRMYAGASQSGYVCAVVPTTAATGGTWHVETLVGTGGHLLRRRIALARIWRDVSPSCCRATR